MSGTLLTNNPNLGNPQRWDRSRAVTCDQDHRYTAEQSADDHGLMDKFVQETGAGLTAEQCLGTKTPTPGNYAVMEQHLRRGLRPVERRVRAAGDMQRAPDSAAGTPGQPAGGGYRHELQRR